MILVGELCLWIALLMAAWGTTVSFAGGATRRADLGASGRRAVYVAAAALLLANAGVIAALLSRDFSFAYVARHTSLDLPRAYVVSALWSGTAGSLLVAGFALAALGSGAVLTWARRNGQASAWVAGTIGALLLMLMLVLCFWRSPYERLGWLAGDGLGLDPILRHPAMVLPRLAELIGVAAVAVGAAAAVGARMSHAASPSPRPWLLPAWTLLSFGLALQMYGWYAYAPAGGVWRWTPFAVVALLLWLLTGAILHVGRGPRDRWRVGEHLSHVGAVVVLVALAAGAFSTSRQLQLRTGQESRVAGPLGREWRFLSQGVSRYGTADHGVTAVALESWHGGTPLGLIVSRQLTYQTVQGGGTPVSEPALRAMPLVDLRIAVDSTDGDLAFVHVTLVPLAGVLWVGAALLILGAIAAMLPVAAPRAAAAGGDA